jgi:hypothetical protein
LEARAERDDGKIDEKAMKALRRRWNLGEATFGDRLLDGMKMPSAKKSRASADPKAHGEAEAERIALATVIRSVSQPFCQHGLRDSPHAPVYLPQIFESWLGPYGCSASHPLWHVDA